MQSSRVNPEGQRKAVSEVAGCCSGKPPFPENSNKNIIFWFRESIEVLHTFYTVIAALGGLADAKGHESEHEKFSLSTTTLIMFIISTVAMYIFEQYAQYNLWRMKKLGDEEGKKNRWSCNTTAACLVNVVQQCFYLGSEEVAKEGGSELANAWLFSDQLFFIGAAAFGLACFVLPFLPSRISIHASKSISVLALATFLAIMVELGLTLNFGAVAILLGIPLVLTTIAKLWSRYPQMSFCLKCIFVLLSALIIISFTHATITGGKNMNHFVFLICIDFFLIFYDLHLVEEAKSLDETFFIFWRSIS